MSQNSQCSTILLSMGRGSSFIQFLAATTCGALFVSCNNRTNDGQTQPPEDRFSNIIEVTNENNFSNFLGAAALLSRRKDIVFDHSSLSQPIVFSCETVYADIPILGWKEGKLYWDDEPVTINEVKKRAKEFGELGANSQKVVVAISGQWDVSMRWGLEILSIFVESGITHFQPPFRPVDWSNRGRTFRP